MAKKKAKKKERGQETTTVTLRFNDELLGTASANPDIFNDFIASKAPMPEETAAEEVDALPDVDADVEKSTTVFSRGADGKPILWDYQIKGFFKDACGMLRRVPGTHSEKLTAYKKCVDGLIFVGPRKIPIVFDAEIDHCTRPLRAQTAQGERIALARSESIPAGATITFEITCLKGDLMDCVDEWLAYGVFRGLGQWRNSGKGRFVVVSNSAAEAATA